MAHRIQDCQGTQMKFNEKLGTFIFSRNLLHLYGLCTGIEKRAPTESN